MSYDIYLKTPEGDIAQVARHREGGTYAVGGSTEAHLNVTYNYFDVFDLVKTPETWIELEGQRDQRPREGFSPRWLYGKTGRETAQMLFRVVQQLGTGRDPSYWAATPGNAGYAASILLIWALDHPDGIWEGD